MTRTTIRSEDITAGQVKAADLASDATSGIQTDIAILGFKVAANGSLAKYDLVDQTIDAFEDASGIDASASTDEIRNAANYYSGAQTGSLLNAYTSGSGSFTAPAGVTSVEVLVVAAGGGGGGLGGGGGGGGVVHHTGYTVVPASTYAYSVGTGGTGVKYNGGVGSNGGNSTFGTGTVITAVGGGGGSGGSADGADGGSGGGGNGGYAPPSFSSVGGSGTQADSGGGTGYGNDAGTGAGGSYYGGGGGGAEAAGSDATGPASGVGGAGRVFSNFDSYGTDASNAKPTADGSGSGKGYFGGGGSGGGGTGTAGAAGVGGGALGRCQTGSYIGDGGSGQANTGGGAGGGPNSGEAADTGGTGGSGIVLVRQADAYNDMTLVSNATTAEAEPTKGDLVMTYTNGAGTATVNTDIKGWVSRDNGTTYTQFTLADDGDTGGHTILTAHDLDISGQPSGTTMRYKITTHNQSVSKQTRIQAVSLGWS